MTTVDLHLHTQVLMLDPSASRSFQSILFQQTNSFRFTGDAGKVVTQMVPISCRGLKLAQVQSTGHEITLSESDNVTVLLPQEGALLVRVGSEEYRATARQPMIFRPTERCTRAVAPQDKPFRAMVLTLPIQRLQGKDQAMESILGRDGMRLIGRSARHLAGYMSFLSEDIMMRKSPYMSAKTQAAIDRLVLTILREIALEHTAEPGDRSPATGAQARVNAAEAIMRAEEDEFLTPMDVARQLGVSLRSLQIAFAEIRGVSPRDRLTALRLERARARLTLPTEATQVTQVALDSGFAHLSRFAQTYARTYGELPSETLARSRKS